MASTYSTSLRLELIATGEQNGTWGTTTNTNLGTLLEQSITGVLSVAQGDVANLTLSTSNGASDQARNAVVNLTGALTAARNVVVPTANKLYLIKNSTTGGYSITVKTAAGTGVAVLPGTNRWVYCDGTNVVDGQLDLQTLSLTALSPSTTDALALGTTSLMWSDLFLASGGVVNWNNGDVTITHSANALAFAGASSGYSFDAAVKPSADDAAALGASGTAWADLFLASGGVLNWNAGDVTITHSANALAFAGASSGYTFDAAVKPASNDGAALGSTALQWSDLFLAAGGVINFANGGFTITYTASPAVAFGGSTNGYFFDNVVAITGSVSAAAGRLVMGSMGSSAVGFLTQASGVGGCIPANFLNSGGSSVGSITSSNTATVYATSSDGRLKKNFRKFDSAPIIDNLVVGAFDWIADDTLGYGVIAQEAFEVFPQMTVQPSKEDGLWQVDYSKLVPVLVREIQMLRERVKDLEGK